MTIAGTGFSATASGDTVDFGSTAATVTAASTTSLTVTTPAEAAGAVPVTVTTSGGTSNSTVDYTYVTPPAGADGDFGHAEQRYDGWWYVGDDRGYRIQRYGVR